MAGPLAERARAEGWDYQRYLAAVLEEEVLARETSRRPARVKAARLPAVKTLDDFDFSFQRSVRQQVIAHFAQLDFLLEAHNVVFLGPPGTGKTHLSIRRLSATVILVQLQHYSSCSCCHGTVLHCFPRRIGSRVLRRVIEKKPRRARGRAPQSGLSTPGALHPQRVIAWSSFPKDATRFTFAE